MEKDQEIPDCKKIIVRKRNSDLKPAKREESIESFRREVLDLKKQVKELQKQIWYTNKQVTKLGQMVVKA